MTELPTVNVADLAIRQMMMQIDVAIAWQLQGFSETEQLYLNPSGGSTGSPSQTS